MYLHDIYIYWLYNICDGCLWLYSKPPYIKGTLCFEVGDGRDGFSPNSPYDLIHVGAAAPSVPPKVIAMCNVIMSNRYAIFIKVWHVSWKNSWYLIKSYCTT